MQSAKVWRLPQKLLRSQIFKQPRCLRGLKLGLLNTEKGDVFVSDNMDISCAGALRPRTFHMTMFSLCVVMS